VADLESAARLVEEAREVCAERDGPFEEVLHRGGEADDLDVALELVRGQAFVAEDVEEAAAVLREERGGEAGDVRRCPLPRREAVERRVESARASKELHRNVVRRIGTLEAFAQEVDARRGAPAPGQGLSRGGEGPCPGGRAG
jgi:hypothetical protein